MKSVMLLNPKGGCGKTTLATNLAGYFAGTGIKTALMDFDPQKSSLEWLKQRRQLNLPGIQGIDASTPAQGMTRSWQLRTEPGTQLLIIDTPAAFDRTQLLDYVSRADLILIPVMPSHIDIRAGARFIKDLLLIAKIRSHNKPVGLIANRTRVHTKILDKLERFLIQLDIPLLAKLRDTQNYIRAMERGACIHDSSGATLKRDRLDWDALINWLCESGAIENTATPDWKKKIALAC